MAASGGSSPLRTEQVHAMSCGDGTESNQACTRTAQQTKFEMSDCNALKSLTEVPADAASKAAKLPSTAQPPVSYTYVSAEVEFSGTLSGTMVGINRPGQSLLPAEHMVAENLFAAIVAEWNTDGQSVMNVQPRGRDWLHVHCVFYCTSRDLVNRVVCFLADGSNLPKLYRSTSDGTSCTIEPFCINNICRAGVGGTTEETVWILRKTLHFGQYGPEDLHEELLWHWGYCDSDKAHKVEGRYEQKLKSKSKKNAEARGVPRVSSEGQEFRPVHLLKLEAKNAAMPGTTNKLLLGFRTRKDLYAKAKDKSKDENERMLTPELLHRLEYWPDREVQERVFEVLANWAGGLYNVRQTEKFLFDSDASITFHPPHVTYKQLVMYVWAMYAPWDHPGEYDSRAQQVCEVLNDIHKEQRILAMNSDSHTITAIKPFQDDGRGVKRLVCLIEKEIIRWKDEKGSSNSKTGAGGHASTDLDSAKARYDARMKDIVASSEEMKCHKDPDGERARLRSKRLDKQLEVLTDLPSKDGPQALAMTNVAASLQAASRSVSGANRSSSDSDNSVSPASTDATSSESSSPGDKAKRNRLQPRDIMAIDSQARLKEADNEQLALKLGQQKQEAELELKRKDMALKEKDMALKEKDLALKEKNQEAMLRERETMMQLALGNANTTNHGNKSATSTTSDTTTEQNAMTLDNKAFIAGIKNCPRSAVSGACEKLLAWMKEFFGEVHDADTTYAAFIKQMFADDDRPDHRSSDPFAELWTQLGLADSNLQQVAIKAHLHNLVFKSSRT